jgi:CheY-like chemotaxis protein
MEAVGRLAGGVAHDFNNLLMGIMGYTELCLEQAGPDHPMREWLDEILHTAQRSADITRQLLAFARKQIIAPKILDLNDTVAGMLKLVRHLIGEDITLAWCPGVKLYRVKIDPAQVDQILANLCVNARDAIAGTGEVVVKTANAILTADDSARHPGMALGKYVRIDFSDNGCGMDKETLALVFEPFFTTKAVGKGTGLGLATVYGIVKQNNGFIEVSSKPGKGTTFRIYLPQAVAVPEEKIGTRAGKPEAPKGNGETILLVEDEIALRTTCGLLLANRGYNVMTAATPEDALKQVALHPDPIQLLLTDVIMPGMDGKRLSQLLLKEYPGMRVLFMSGYTADVIAICGVLDKGVNFLSKPFSSDDLARKVREVLDAGSRSE